MLQSRQNTETNHNLPDKSENKQQPDNMGSYLPPIEEIDAEQKIDIPIEKDSVKPSQLNQSIPVTVNDTSKDSKDRKDIKNMNKEIDYIIRYNSKEKDYLLNTPENNPIGSFNLFQLVKFIGNQISPNFMKDIDMMKSNVIIEKYVVKYEKNIILISYLDSPFMRDINVLIAMCNDLCIYEKKYMSDYLKNEEDPQIRTSLYNILEDFIYMFYNHTLSIISFIISNTGKYTSTNNVGMVIGNTCINIDLLKFSSMLTHKITKHALETLNKQTIYLAELKTNMQTLQTARDKLTNGKKTLHEKLLNQDKIIKEVNTTHREDTFASMSGGSSSASDIVDEIIKDIPTTSVANRHSKSMSETNGFKSAENTQSNNRLNYISDE